MVQKQKFRKVSKAHAQRSHKVRRGAHQKQTKTFVSVYWPYIPLLVVVSVGLLFSNLWGSRNGVLAYATSMSRSALLSSTNQHRANSSAGALSINSKLNSAAQAKANDMVERDYWAHNTPDGNPPWVFIDAAGYDYNKAGENLAYGFATSADTVTGWMNSPSHKANMLDGTFTEVGFGFANSPDFVDTGKQTIVVAMYAKPTVAAATVASTPPPAPAPTPVPPPQTKAAEQTAEKPPAKKKPQEKPKEVTVEEEKPVNTENPVIAPAQTQSVSRINILTGGNMPWISGAVLIIGLGSIILFVLRHSWTLRRWVVRGEKYVLHHVAFDVAIVSLTALSFMAIDTAGKIL